MLAINDTTTTVTPPSDTASLSWTPRASLKELPNVQIVYYYAIASVPLSADSVTFGLSSAVAAVCLGFGVSGADTSAPFDPNVGMPNKNSGSSSTATLEYDTSNPNDLLIVLEGFCAQGAAGSGSPSGFTLVNGGNVRPSNCAAEGFQSVIYSEIVSTTQSSSTNSVTWTFDTAISPFAVIGDAIQSAPGPTLTSVTCAGPFIANRGSTCNVTVIDNSPGTFITPTGTVGLSQTGVTGTFTACILVGTSASATCSSIFTASTNGTVAITASYPGDSTHTSSTGTTSIAVSSALSITFFTASPTMLDPGEKVTFTVTTSGGDGALSYSYANLPASCLSVNATSLSCYPTSSGNYRVTVTVTDRAMESANATAIITVGPQRVLGLPQAIGLAVIIGAIAGTGGVVVLSVAIALRRKKGRQAPAKA